MARRAADIASLVDKQIAAVQRNRESKFMSPSEFSDLYYQRRPTGIRELDRLFHGGYPCGCNVIITGPPNVGKDLLINRMLSAGQREKGADFRALLIYNERLDKGFGRLQGVRWGFSKMELDLIEDQLADGLPEPVKRQLLYVLTQDELMEVFTERKFSPKLRKKLSKDAKGIWIQEPKTLNEALDSVLDAARIGGLDAVVVNSLDSLSRRQEKEAVDQGGIDAHLKGRGGEGRAQDLSAFFRQLNSIMTEPIVIDKEEYPKLTNFFWISQQREAGISGGNAYKHSAGLRLDLRRINKEATHSGAADFQAESHVATSDMISVYVQKGKYGIADGVSGRFRYYKNDHVEKDGTVTFLAGTIDESSGLRAEAAEYNIIHHRGSGYDIRLLKDGEDPASVATLLGEFGIQGSELVSDIEYKLTDTGVYLLKTGRPRIERLLNDFPLLRNRIEELVRYASTTVSPG